MKTKKTKIGRTVWILGNPENDGILLSGTNKGPLDVYANRPAAVSRKKLTGTAFEVIKATITRDGEETDDSAEISNSLNVLGATERILAENVDQTRKDAAEILRLRDELKKTKIDLSAAAGCLASLEKQIHEGKIWNKENPRWTPRVQQALALAEKESEARNATYVGTEHILLGLLRQEEGVASHHFRAIGMSYEKVCYALKVARCS